MPNIKPMLHVEIDPSRPVPELCGLIAHLLAGWQGQEIELLTVLKGEIDHHIQRLEGGKQNG